MCVKVCQTCVGNQRLTGVAMGKIILSANVKGGVGKSTYSCNAAAYLANAGFDIALVDTDEQENSNKWSAIREMTIDNPPKFLVGKKIPQLNVSIKRGTGVKQYVQDLAKRFDYVIIDSGGYDSPEMRAGLMVADCWICPIEVSDFSIQAFEQMSKLLNMVNDFRNAPLVCHPFVNKGDTRDLSFEKETLKITLESAGMSNDFQILNSVVRARKAFKKAESLGVSVGEYGDDIKARSEFSFLMQEILNLPEMQA